jgi:ubiquitin-like-conjugating enzyme ATG3
MTTLGYLRGVREWAYPTRTASAFLEKGVLTPDEFVAAGDELVYRAPTWTWEGVASGMDASKVRPYLPPDKQYLVTRGVPCQSRVTEQEVTTEAETMGGDVLDDGEEWLVSQVVQASNAPANVEDDFDILDETGEVVVAEPPAVPPGLDDGKPAVAEEYADMADFEDDNVLEDADAAQTPAEDQDNVLHVRTYDLSITYDKYYQTPRVWMVGASANHQPLTADEMMEDVMKDYRHKTVTLEHHPHTSGIHASVHPCQHGKVMKRIVHNLMAAAHAADGGQAEEPTVELYLFIFLKFVSSIIPTINYDFTMGVEASTRKG